MRTEPDSYGWRRYWMEDESGEAVCGDCVAGDPVGFLRAIEGRCDRCLSIGLALADHGYVLIEGEFEHGLYGGQDADPVLVGQALREQGIGRFLFVLDAVGQFDLSFSVFVHESEADGLDSQRFAAADKSGFDPATGLRESLADASRQIDALPKFPAV